MLKLISQCIRKWLQQPLMRRMNRNSNEFIKLHPDYLYHRLAILLAMGLMVSGCGLPRSGPTKNEIIMGSVSNQGNSIIIPIDTKVIAQIARPQTLGFSASFKSVLPLGIDIFRHGDILNLTIYENVEAGLLGTESVPSNVTELQVDHDGYVFIPYVGRIKVSGKTPEVLRKAISEKLSTQTPDPQVIVRRVAGNGSTISIIGTTTQGFFPIDASSATLSAMIARAGGVITDAANTQITVLRGSRKGTVWLSQLYSGNQQDIALRPGDRILVEEDKRKFTAIKALNCKCS